MRSKLLKFSSFKGNYSQNCRKWIFAQYYKTLDPKSRNSCFQSFFKTQLVKVCRIEQYLELRRIISKLGLEQIRPFRMQYDVIWSTSKYSGSRRNFCTHNIVPDPQLSVSKGLQTNHKVFDVIQPILRLCRYVFLRPKSTADIHYGYGVCLDVFWTF